jgi:rsbT co-antagonist protein RsbR
MDSAFKAGYDRRFRLQPAPRLILGFDGRLFAANLAWDRASGILAGALGDRPIDELIHPEDRARFRSELTRMERGEESLSWSARILRADGAVRWMEWNAVTSPEDNGIQVVLYDSTERNLAVEEAREKERFLATLMSNLPGMVYRCLNDPSWTMEFVSAGSEALTGYQPGDLIKNRVASFADLIVPEDQGLVWDKVQAAVAERTPFFIKYRIRTRGGEEKWVYEKGRGVFDEKGDLLAIEGFLTDITASVRAEQDLIDKLRIIEAQRDAIRHLSTPIIEVWEGVLTLPIVGAVDRERAADITQTFLQAIAQKRCRHAILDLTGVEAMDTTTAEHIVRMLRAAELLGARGVLVGIRPDVAQTLVRLHVDLSTVVTLSDLREALIACMGAAETSAGARSRAPGARRAV